MSFASTITVPCQDDPNFLHACLHALVRHSRLRHRIIVLWDTEAAWHPGKGGPRDFNIDPASGEVTARYHSVEQYRASHEPWLREHGIEVWDVTAGYHDLLQRYRRGEVWPGKSGQDPEGGVNIAYKNNIGLRHTTTEWTIPNWDTDFHPCAGWDVPIFEYARSLSPDRREVLVPMHVQPQIMGDPVETFDAWGTPSRQFSRHRMAIPSTRVTPHGQAWVRESDWLAYAERNRRPGHVIRERPGDREHLHWVPWILRTDHVREVGGFSYQGSGYDLAFDDRLRDRGFMKAGIGDSFVLHKGWCPIEPGVCGVPE